MQKKRKENHIRHIHITRNKERYAYVYIYVWMGGSQQISPKTIRGGKEKKQNEYE